MKVTSLFWNVWLNNHFANQERREAVWTRLEELLDEHDPDVVGLNEVVTDHEKHEPPLVKILRERGYHCIYYPFIPLDDGRFMGNVMATKHDLDKHDHVYLGPNVVAAAHGFPGTKGYIDFAEITIKGAKPFTFGVIHTLPLYLYAVPEHYRQQITVANYMNKKVHHPAIIGGDFNEFKRIMPRSQYSLVRKNYRRVTGSYINPTWVAYANDLHPIRANYDHIYWTRNNDDISLDSFKVHHKHPSDHAPIVGVFDIAEE